MDNTNWSRALSKFQPSTGGGGPASAGNPGMGGGSIPYAPGATQFQPPSSPPPGQPQPQGGGAPAGMAVGQNVPQPGGGGRGGQPAYGDPQRAIMVANYLMARLKHQMAQRGQSRRG